MRSFTSMQSRYQISNELAFSSHIDDNVLHPLFSGENDCANCRTVKNQAHGYVGSFFRVNIAFGK